MQELCARCVQAGASHELRQKEMMYGEKMRVRSREHLTPLMLLVQVVFSQRFLGEASSSAIGSHPPAAKKTKRASKWQEDWKKYNMKESKGGASFVPCNLCGNDFSIASGGVHEVKRHVATKRHTELAKGNG